MLSHAPGRDLQIMVFQLALALTSPSPLPPICGVHDARVSGALSIVWHHVALILYAGPPGSGAGWQP